MSEIFTDYWQYMKTTAQCRKSKGSMTEKVSVSHIYDDSDDDCRVSVWYLPILSKPSRLPALAHLMRYVACIQKSCCVVYRDKLMHTKSLDPHFKNLRSTFQTKYVTNSIGCYAVCVSNIMSALVASVWRSWSRSGWSASTRPWGRRKKKNNAWKRRKSWRRKPQKNASCLQNWRRDSATEYDACSVWCV